MERWAERSHIPDARNAQPTAASSATSPADSLVATPDEASCRVEGGGEGRPVGNRLPDPAAVRSRRQLPRRTADR